MRSGLIVVAAVVAALGWTLRSHLPFVGSSHIGSAAGAGTTLVQLSDRGLLGGGGPRPAAGAVCTASGKPAGMAENPRLVQEGVAFSFYNCRLRLLDGGSQRWCVAAGQGGGAPVQYTGLPGTCQRPVLLQPSG